MTILRLILLATVALVAEAAFAECEPEAQAYESALIDVQNANANADAAYDAWMLDPSDQAKANAYLQALEAVQEAEQEANEKYNLWQMCLNLVRVPQKSAAQLLQEAPPNSVLIIE